MRQNLLTYLRNRTRIFEGIIGYDYTVIPHIQQAILGRHDMILLGLRGQAKSRLIRLLPKLLDEYVPVIEGSEVNDDPLAPISKYGRDLVATHDADTPIAWLHRSERYGEKLATPDTTIADLIGDIDPIKAAHRKLTYADEEVIHFGIIPRTNRGIFAINELPDLQARIQVGLLNILEEQDIQIRGFNIRFPLDLLMVFSANPEDYTSRGNIITPLKDRIDSQIMTHYPQTARIGRQITAQEAWQVRGKEAPKVKVPSYLLEVIEQIAIEARESEFVDRNSGVSARLTRCALEELISAAELRAILKKQATATARIHDFDNIAPAITGKIELIYEGEQEGVQNVTQMLIGRAIRRTFPNFFPNPSKREYRGWYSEILDWFAAGNSATVMPEASLRSYWGYLSKVKGLTEFVVQRRRASTRAMMASEMGFVLEGLHQFSLLGKEKGHGGSTLYSDLVGSVMSSIDIDPPDDDDDFDI